MRTATQLKEQRAALVAKMRQSLDKIGDREATAEERGEYEKMEADVFKLGAEAEAAERRERLETLEAEQRASAGRRTDNTHRTSLGTQQFTKSERNSMLRAWALASTPLASHDADTQVRAAQAGVHLSSRALSIGTATAGGHTVPVTLASEIERQMKYFSPITTFVTLLETDKGEDITWPRVTDIGNTASIVGEAGTIATNVDPAFDNVTVKAYKYATTIVKLSAELLQDSGVDLEAMLGEMLAERMARGQEAHFAAGTGTNQPEGLDKCAVALNLPSGNAITHDNVIDLIHSVDVGYRMNAAFAAHDNTIAGIMKLKDSTGQYLWQPSVQAGQPDRLRNYPVAIINSLTPIGTPGDNKPLLLFGNMKKYLVRKVRASRQVTRLDELYAATGEIGFVMLERADGRYIGHSGCVKSINSYDTP